MTVLVVGSIRMLGSKIVAAVFDKGTVEVKAMVRSSNDSYEEKRLNIDEMKAKGAGIIEGDLMKPETLLRTCAEVDVIVSAVGNNQVTVLGQKNLIYAAKQHGVKRFIPSDYSVGGLSQTLPRATTTTWICRSRCLNICLWLLQSSLELHTQAMNTKSPTSLRSWGF